MSYTKLDKEIERYYKTNNMSFHYNALTTTKEEQADGLKKYKQVRDVIVQKFLTKKKRINPIFGFRKKLQRKRQETNF